MCEIQLIQKLGDGRIDRSDIGEFFKLMCFGALHNRDAFGVFNDEISIKDSGPFNPSKLNLDDVSESSFLVGHNRLSTNWTKVKRRTKKTKAKKKKVDAPTLPQPTKPRYKPWDSSTSFIDNVFNMFFPTCGWENNMGIYVDKSSKVPEDIEYEYIDDWYGYDNSINHHPFELGDFTLVHNGVISNAQAIYDKYMFDTRVTTDSYAIIGLINHFFKKSKIVDRVNRIAYAIEMARKELIGGYSVILYDKIGNNTFYFKNIFTSFYFCKYGEDILCGSTSQDNLSCAYQGLPRENISIKSDRVYLITHDSKSPIVDVTQGRPRRIKQSLYKILSSRDSIDDKTRRIEEFFINRMGFVPMYKMTRMGHLKIATNNAYGIKDKIRSIVKKPRRWFGWYIIKASDLKPIGKSDAVEVYKMKGGKR